MQTLVVDAGPLYAYIDRDERAHAAALDLFRTWAGPLVVPVLAVTEVAYLVSTRLGTTAELLLLKDLAVGTFVTDPVAAGDWPRIAQLVARYRDLPLGTVDASVVATAERMGVSTVATLDHRHFRVVRPRHVDAFELLP